MTNKIALYAPFDKRIKNDGFLEDFDDLKRYAKISTDLTKLGFEVEKFVWRSNIGAPSKLLVDLKNLL